VQGVDEGTAEEFYGRLNTDATVLHEASVRFAADRDDVSALACIVGADIATLEAVVWERLNIAPRAPQRQFFQAVASVSSAVDGLRGISPTEELNAAAFVEELRRRLLTPFDDGLAVQVMDSWGPIEHLRSIPLPSADEIEAARSTRMEGLSAREYIRVRRESAAEAMAAARLQRVKGAVSEAIQSAYESDFLAMEAYLVESALAAGDPDLLTVVTRHMLVGRAVADLPGLPADFGGAVSAIRGAMADGLGEADGARLREALVSV